MDKHFNLNQNGCSIRCRLYARDDQPTKHLVLYGHGFGGHKDTRAAARFAEYYISKQKDAAVLCFDWPCHGDDARKKLVLADCDLYLRCVIEYARGQFPEAMLLAYATSFGGYLFLNYMAEHGNPFEKAAFRCPAVPMYQVLTRNIVKTEEAELLKKGKDVLVGFDRKIRISPDFLDSLRKADLNAKDFTPYCNDILILHGTKDEIVPIAEVEAFADRNNIPFFPIEKADHRFVDPGKMLEAIQMIVAFFE